jgi:hypothetical protein
MDGGAVGNLMGTFSSANGSWKVFGTMSTTMTMTTR